MRKILSFLAILLVPALAAAQGGRSRIEVTPFAGYRLAGDFNAPSSDNIIRLGAQVDESATYGVTLSVPLNEHWRFEVTANRQETSLTIDEGFLTPDVKLGDIDLTMVHAGFALEWGDGQVKPFLLASGGVTRIDPKFRELAAEDRLSGSLGGGVKILFSDQIGLRLEGRGYWTDLDTRFHDRYSRYDTNDGLYQYEGTAGLIFRF
jgi:hypothetical protein